MADTDSHRRRGNRKGEDPATPTGSVGAEISSSERVSANSEGLLRPRAGIERMSDSELQSLVPEHIRQHYIQVRTRFYFSDGDPAFRVRANRTTTTSDNSQVIRDILEIEKERSGGARLRLRGTAEFRAEAWMQAQLMGIDVRGYRPSDLERATVAKTIAREQRRAPDIAAGKSPEGLIRDEMPQPANPPPTSRDSRPERERTAPSEKRVYRGRLIEHGAAPYQHDRHAEMSYYIRLDMRSGERVLWGKDFERAIKHSLSGVKLGDDVGVQHVGERPVTVVVRRAEESGDAVRREEVAAYRNRWLVERQDFLREREEVARVVRDPTISAQEATKRHPNLVGTYVELRAAELVAQELYRDPDDRRNFITRFRNAVADEVARGERFPVPRVKAPAGAEKVRPRGRVLSREPAQERVLN